MITGLGSAKDLASGKKGAFYNTLEEFHKYWERIDIIAPRIKGQESRTKELFGNVYVHISPWPIIFHPLWFLKKGLEIYKEQRFNLMTVHEFPPFYNGIGARLLWQKIKVPYILEIHHVPGHPKAASLKEKIYRNLTRWFIKIDALKASAVRVVNQNQTPEFLRKAGISKDKIVYIPSAYIDLDVFRPMDLSKKYDLIFVGRLEINKGINLLLEAVKILLTIHSKQLKVLIVGDGLLRKDLDLKVKNLKLQDNVMLYGRAQDQEEIAGLINKSKIFVMPSYNEGGPRVVVEAMACGVPVLATDVGFIPDFAHKNAVKMIDWNAKDIANKIKKLLEDEDERNRIIMSGIEVAKQFEKKTTIKNYAEVLKKHVF